MRARQIIRKVPKAAQEQITKTLWDIQEQAFQQSLAGRKLALRTAIKSALEKSNN